MWNELLVTQGYTLIILINNTQTGPDYAWKGLLMFETGCCWETLQQTKQLKHRVVTQQNRVSPSENVKKNA